MSKFRLNIKLLVAVSILVASCSASRKINKDNPGITSLQYINTYEIPYNLKYNNTTVGGLSGIDYDAINNLYYFICDDRNSSLNTSHSDSGERRGHGDNHFPNFI